MCTEEFLLWKEKKGNAGLYLKDDYETRDADRHLLYMYCGCISWNMEEDE